MSGSDPCDHLRSGDGLDSFWQIAAIHSSGGDGLDSFWPIHMPIAAIHKNGAAIIASTKGVSTMPIPIAMPTKIQCMGHQQCVLHVRCPPAS